ncbi:hypothetical protein So717_39720 [Roseobacter cerasinus]|uniref:Lipoprotein n=1 Tax=Roseobacter cerasinus TaxID=2602289 RepID=A0A640VW16_9RHOB|nr:hypothetical protein [Roseobacter cerasinus]GFE52219.1 hypothetical protein So717_39720 [Roseobacter cerasinus]
MRIFAMLAVLAALSACAAPSPFEVTAQEAAARAYVPEGPPKLTLFTMVNNTTGAGGHTALMVSGSQQVIFDPAGSFQHELVAERGDVLYGMSPAWVQAYKSAHARNSHHVVSQEIVVTPEQAERALQLVMQNGSVGSAFCTNSTSSILRQVPGFDGVRVTFYPIKLMEQIAGRSDVVTDRYYENDAGDVLDGIEPAEG